MAGKLIVDELENGSGITQGTNPTGTVIMYYGATAPSGYLECNGQIISTANYPKLHALIGSTVPDLRGEFVRGWDNGKGVDTGRSLGSTQDDAFQGHYHNLQRTQYTANLTLGGVGAGNLGNAVTNAVEEPSTDGTNGTPRTSSETRPRNVALMYCIKT